MPESVGGTYTLCVELPEPATIPVGALGETAFEPGWYAYCGTALGSGGFCRVERTQGADGECDYPSHLVYSADRARLLGSVRRAHRRLDGGPVQD